MKEKIISFQTAVLAKYKEIIIESKYCYGWIDHEDIGDEKKVEKLESAYLDFDKSNSYAPRQSKLQTVLRTKYGIHVYCVLGSSERYYFVVHNRKFAHGAEITSQLFNDYEEALEQGLRKGLEMLY